MIPEHRTPHVLTYSFRELRKTPENIVLFYLHEKLQKNKKKLISNSKTAYKGKHEKNKNNPKK